ncbi:MAG: ABC transporter ATP-binding protein [Deltaproteobacteria bacterium]|nr:ABC transporter ATP-binding protein [Deltaproteobacteria bacterium]
MSSHAHPQGEGGPARPPDSLHKDLKSSRARSSSHADDASLAVGLGAQLKRNLFYYALGTFALIALQTLMSVRDRLFKAGVDHALASRSAETTRVVVLVLVVVISAAAIRVASRMTLFHAGRMGEYELRRALLGRLQRLGAAFFRRMPVGEIMSRATNDLTQVRLLLGFGVLNVLNTAFALISALSVMIGVSGPLTLAALVPLPLVMLVTRGFSRSLYVRNRDNQASLGKLSERVQESLAGVRVVRSFSLEQAEQSAFEHTSLDYLDKSLAIARLRGFMTPIMAALSAAGTLIVFWYGGHLVLTHQITHGDFIAFWAALARLTWPIIAFGFIMSMVQRGRASYVRLKDIFDAVPDVVDGELPAPANVRGAIEVRNLTFSYGTQRVLDCVSLKVDAGRSLAIVGRVGSGKSTVASLIARLMPTPRGTVLLDGIDVCDLPLATVHRAIGLAWQDAFLFSTTVARNVGFSLDEPDSPEGLDRIRLAAGEAHVLEEMMALPQQLDTIVGERGVQVSGGQKQRIALARALVYQPAVLILDDPLSAVDARTEKAILDTIEREIKRRTVILITSRVAAACRCDSIAVLGQGRVIEQGTHDELVALGGQYARFAEEQRIQSEIEAIGAALRNAEGVSP